MQQTLVRKQLGIDVKEADIGLGTIRAVISSGMPDRAGEMIDQSTWNLNNYLKNPVVLWGHDHSRPAIGKAISIGLNEEGMLEATIQFAINESQFAREIFELYANGFLKAFSVGFINNLREEVNGVWILKENELYEFSAVNIGMDALALAKSKGFNVDEIVKINEKVGRVLSAKNRNVLEKARQALDEVLNVDSEKEKVVSKKKFQYNKIINKAIRELIQLRK